MLLDMLDQVKAACGRPSASMLLPDVQPPRHGQSASHSWEVAQDDFNLVAQELKDAVMAAKDAQETWHQLDQVCAELPAPQPESMSSPGPEKLPWPKLQTFEGDSMAVSPLSPQPQMAMRACLLAAPEFKLGDMTTAVPTAGGGPAKTSGV